LPRWRGPLDAEFAVAKRCEPFSGPGWLFELKYDGFRLLAAKDGREVTLRYRSGRDATAVFPELVAAVATLPARRLLLDGELVVFGSDGRSDFERLRSRAMAADRRAAAGTASACLFDVLAIDEHDVRRLPLIERKGLLRELLVDQDRLLYVDHVEGRGEELLAGARRLRLEGVMAKRADSRYRGGTASGWRKLKLEETSDFVVIGLARPSERTFGLASLLLATVVDEQLAYAGRAAIGAAESEAVAELVPTLARRTPPCSVRVPRATWLEPALVCEVRFLASSGPGLRHPTFLRFRPDKPWSECRSELGV
jgi:bifunctional non-homologous end joining protein LigD